MLKSMSIHQKDIKMMVKSDFVTSCLAFRDFIPTMAWYCYIIHCFITSIDDVVPM